VVGVGEAVPDQHRAYSLNTGWVKVPVKFPALAVVGWKEGDYVKTLGKFIVVGYCGRKYEEPHWTGSFSCGGETIVSSQNLMRPTPPHSGSCGCLRRKMMGAKMKLANSCSPVQAKWHEMETGAGGVLDALPNH